MDSAPCFRDDCLFLTNVSAFPMPDAVTFRPAIIRHLHDVEANYMATGRFPSNDFFQQHAYHHAVDGDPTTCWSSYQGSCGL